MSYAALFWSFCQIGLFSIGGGYAALPLIQAQTVQLHSWLTLEQFTDLITIAEMTPGPIAINAATFVGMQLASVPGAIVATLGCILPSCVIVSLLALFYYKHQNSPGIQGILSGLRPAVVALIASAGVTILVGALFGENGFVWNIQAMDFIALGLFAAALLVLRRFKPNAIYVMLGTGVVGGILYLIAGLGG